MFAFRPDRGIVSVAIERALHHVFRKINRLSYRRRFEFLHKVPKDDDTGDLSVHPEPKSITEQRVVPEKCDLNSLLFLLTPAEDESKLNTLVAKLVKFKNLWDRDAPLQEVLPTVFAANRERYAGYTVRQICKEMHSFYRNAGVKELQRLCFRSESFPEPAIAPKQAYEALVANNVDYLPLTEAAGRISATLALIYPPGIGVIVPGERWDDRARPMRDYFLAFEESFNRFPGFNYEVQGVFQERLDGRIKFYTYVVRE